MNIHVVAGRAGFDLLRDPAFTARWQALYEACAWATPFRSPAFVTAWYETYANEFAPLIARGVAADGALVGVLTLAIDAGGGAVHAAGADRAEYQAWVARETDGPVFIAAALRRVLREHGGRPLVFHHLPAGTPTGWISEDLFWKRRCRLERVAAPVMDLCEDAGISASRRRKTQRTLARLQRSGDVRFEQLRTSDELAAVIEPIATQYDFRQAAVNDYVHFGQDARRRQFQLALMRTPGLLHATVLRHGDSIVAANLGLSGKNRVYLGIFSNAAAYAKTSPGKLHLVMLGDYLAQTAYRQLDLTPGEDAYKPAFASRYEQVSRLTIYPTATQRRLAALRAAGRQTVNRALTAVGVSARTVRKRLHGMRHRGVRDTIAIGLAAAWHRIWAHDEIRVYAISVAGVADPPPGLALQRDALDDLLRFNPSPGSSPRQEFLARALARIGHGHHVYTCVENGTLIHHGWMAENRGHAQLTEVGQDITFPPRSSILYDYYTHPSARGRGLYKRSLRHMMHAAASSGRSDWIFIWVLAGNAASRHVIEQAGFHYRGSAFQRNVLGWVKRRSTFDAPAAQTKRITALPVSVGEGVL